MSKEYLEGRGKRISRSYHAAITDEPEENNICYTDRKNQAG
jgi:hypothetical protein